MALGYGLPPPTVAPLAAHLSALLISLGERCVARRAGVQRRLLLAVLHARAEPPPEADLDLRALRHLDLRHLGGGGARWSAGGGGGGGGGGGVDAEEAGRVAAIEAVERAVAAEAAAMEAAAASAAAGEGGGTLVRLPERGGDDNQVTSGTRLRGGANQRMQAAAPTVDASGNLSVPLLAPSGEEEARQGEYLPPGGGAVAGGAAGAAGAAGEVGGAAGGERVAVRLPSPVSAGQMCSAKLPDGRTVMFKAPANALPGMMMQVQTLILTLALNPKP